MSDTQQTPIQISGTALVIAIAAMFIATIAAVVALALGLPEAQNPAGLAAQLLGSFAVLVTALGTLFTVTRRIQKLDQAVTDSAADTRRVVQQTNGNLDSRIRSLSYDAMRKALADHIDKNPDDDPPF